MEILDSTIYPYVSVIMPVRNEAAFIERSVGAVMQQDYPAGHLEILVVDGMSDDGTRDIVCMLEASDPRVRLIDNPERIVPTALNRGIRFSRGEIIIRVDGHAVIAPDYVRNCIEVGLRTQADVVGGPIRTIGETRVARAISLAQSSPFGVGNAAFRYSQEPQYVDTLAFGAHRREVFDQVGMFDPELVRNQDDEFNFRLTRSGKKLWLDPSIHSDYYSRASFRGLWKQYFEYGFWKVRVIQKHGRAASWRHLVPAAFVLALLTSFILATIFKTPLDFLVVVVPYIAVSLFASFWLSIHYGRRLLPILPLTFLTMHTAYGLGFILGTIHFGLVSLSGTPSRKKPTPSLVTQVTESKKV